MMYRINEVFLSIQGEGTRVGTPSLFLRFAGCNLNCAFCDTPHSRFIEMTLDDLRQKITSVLLDSQYPIVGEFCSRLDCVITGGEPLLQLDNAIVDMLDGMGFDLWVETNGTVPLLASPDKLSITVSPKAESFEELDESVLKAAAVIKLLVPLRQPRAVVSRILADNSCLDLILQPITPRKGFDQWEWKDACIEAVALAINWRRDYDEYWKVIPQTHVIMGMK